MNKQNWMNSNVGKKCITINKTWRTIFSTQALRSINQSICKHQNIHCQRRHQYYNNSQDTWN